MIIYYYSLIVNMYNYKGRVSFRGGRGEHSPLLGFGLPPLGNFDLKVNQFKCFEIFNSCTMHNKC